MKIWIFAFAIVVLAGCSSENEARRVLAGQGYTNINTTGYAFFGCDEKDDFHTGFEAISPNGSRVEGVVCSGFLKGATVRFK